MRLTMFTRNMGLLLVPDQTYEERVHEVICHLEKPAQAKWFMEGRLINTPAPLAWFNQINSGSSHPAGSFGVVRVDAFKALGLRTLSAIFVFHVSVVSVSEFNSQPRC